MRRELENSKEFWNEWLLQISLQPCSKKEKFIEDCKIKFRRCLVRINDALIFAIRLKKISSL